MKHHHQAGGLRFPALALLFLFLMASAGVQAFEGNLPVTIETVRGSFPLIVKGDPIAVVVSGADFQGVQRAAGDLCRDLGRVSGRESTLFKELPRGHRTLIIAGTLGMSPLVDDLVARGKIKPREIEGQWESTLMEVVKNPFPGVRQALVIAGSDKRGTIFGIYDLSASMGVSPWSWWADVPVKKAENLSVTAKRVVLHAPKVKYRGFFINDEAPALSGWVFEKFGAFNHAFYENVFELILRMKGNFLWPAMWGRAFYDDDPLNPALADAYGVVIGTSHHEPMMRAHDEWRRFGRGPWNYRENPDTLREFWRSGISRMGSYESLVTVGMRGDGDEPMSRDADISLLEQIIAHQREIIEEVTGREASQTPQVWALYKEVQDYYDLGMRVPDDVTLMLCDDNWGNVRKLPRIGAPGRSGGYGMYYHFDYVGGPRNYKWLNTNPIPRVWEQMNLTYRHGVDRIWIVNVGDIKPMEFPTQFFLDMAWDPEAMTMALMESYSLRWAGALFGEEHAAEIARMVDSYGRFNGRRKPELLDPSTYSLVNYREAERVAAGYNALAEEARRLSEQLPPEARDAFFQLVLFPIEACANLNDLYVTAGKNRLYASQGRSTTNSLAQRVTDLFLRDSLLTLQYNRELAGGKWNHMMDQTHIGYYWWQEPPRNIMPRVQTITLPEEEIMRVAVEGSPDFLGGGDSLKLIIRLDTWQTDSTYADIFAAGTLPIGYTITCDAPWLRISPRQGTISGEERIWFSPADGSVPAGLHTATITITPRKGDPITLFLEVFHPEPLPSGFLGFAESNGHFSIEAAHFSRKSEKNGLSWEEVPGLGRTLSGMTTFPVTAPGDSLPANNPTLEYDLWFHTSGEVEVILALSPTLNYYGTGKRVAVAIDDQPPRILNIHGNYTNRDWEEWMRHNIIYVSGKHTISSPGKHRLIINRIDPGVVVQKIIIDTGGVQKSFLGPPAFPMVSGK